MEKAQKSAVPALPRRLAALLYDTLLVLPFIMVSVAAAMGLAVAVRGGEATALNPHLVRLIALLCLVVFYSAFWLKSGQTLGMQAWRIKLVSVDTDSITPHQCLLRLLAAALSLACFGAGFWWCLIDRQGRYWHDRLSGTRLILADKNGGGKSAAATTE